MKTTANENAEKEGDRMKNKVALTIMVTLVALAIMPLAPTASAQEATAASDDCKVGFVNLARVLEESREGKALRKKLDAERDKAMAPIESKKKQLEALEQKITALTQEIIQKGSVWDDDTKLIKQNELQNLQLQYQQLLNAIRLEKDQISQKLMKKKNEMLRPLEDKLNKIMEQVGKDGGYCIIFDVSPPTSNMPNFNPIIFRDPGRDITDQVIQAVDK